MKLPKKHPGLVISRKIGESVQIGDHITVTIAPDSRYNRVKLRILAPPSYTIHRVEKIKEEKHPPIPDDLKT